MLFQLGPVSCDFNLVVYGYGKLAPPSRSYHTAPENKTFDFRMTAVVDFRPPSIMGSQIQPYYAAFDSDCIYSNRMWPVLLFGIEKMTFWP
jgi:hypothetical protein